MSNFFETICAITTPLAKSGVGIVRVSGDRAYNIVSDIFNKKIVENKINYGLIKHNGKIIDEVIVLYFKSPKSYTGEDVVEIQAHGNPIILNEILNLLIEKGAIMAQRGEFTKRAFLNHKIDLTEAEAVADLIDSKTVKGAQKNLSNLTGMLYEKTSMIKEKITEILSKITASIDFPEDVPEVPYEIIIDKLNEIKFEIENILKSSSSHNILRQGVKVAITGRPNAGKSSLFNSLLNIKRAIVTEIEGTTRDTISESFEIKGVLFTLIDTAGIRESKDKIEAIGVNLAKNAVEQADITLLLFDSSSGITKEDKEIFDLAKNKKTILVASKSDLCSKKYDNAISISSKTGENIEFLKEEIYKKAVDFDIDETEYTTNQRQQESFFRALNSINAAITGAKNQQLQDLISIDIKAALIALGEVTGEVINDEILNAIFEKFCIGK